MSHKATVAEKSPEEQAMKAHDTPLLWERFDNGGTFLLLLSLGLMGGAVAFGAALDAMILATAAAVTAAVLKVVSLWYWREQEPRKEAHQ